MYLPKENLVGDNMKKKNKILIILSTIIILISFMFCTKIVDADSGWDSSYDSGGSWDSGSSWSSSSSSSNANVSDGQALAGVIFTIIFYLIIFIVLKKYISAHPELSKPISSLHPSNMQSKHNYADLTKEEIDKIDASLNKEELKNITFDIFEKVQESWMNINYQDLRKYTSDELYNMYESQLKVLQAKNQKNIMENITYLDAKIIDITIENSIEKVKVYLNISMKDYVVDSKNKVVRGDKNITNWMEYLITLTRNIEDNKLDKCPSCNAPIDIKVSGKCQYCDSLIINNNNEFVMSKKECIGQKRI